MREVLPPGRPKAGVSERQAGSQCLRDNSFRDSAPHESEGAVAFRLLNSAQNIEAASAAGRSESIFVASTRVLTQSLQPLRTASFRDSTLTCRFAQLLQPVAQAPKGFPGLQPRKQNRGRPLHSPPPSPPYPGRVCAAKPRRRSPADHSSTVQIRSKITKFSPCFRDQPSSNEQIGHHSADRHKATVNL
jgi:hypothetical protein